MKDRIGRCPVDVEHGRLLDLRGGEWLCPHAGHHERGNDQQPELRRQVWTTEELRATGVLP